MAEIPIVWNIQPEKWAAMFSAPSFRTGWIDARAGRESPMGTVEGVTGRVSVKQADVDIIYVLGRLMALETASLKLPLPNASNYLTVQMKMVIDSCPAMIQNLVTEMKISVEGQKALADLAEEHKRRSAQ